MDQPATGGAALEVLAGIVAEIAADDDSLQVDEPLEYAELLAEHLAEHGFTIRWSGWPEATP